MTPQELNEIKRESGPEDVHELIARRWSPRAFDPDTPVPATALASVLEAAAWAPSCFGDEPWRYVVCNRHENEAAWTAALGCLAEKNQRWARNAPVLMCSVAAAAFRNGRPNRWGQHDTGAASENLCLQAAALGLAAHQMGGFDKDKAREAFAIPEGFEPMAMIALGHQGGPETLDEDLREAELGPRTRSPRGELFFAARWGEPVQG